MDADWMQRLRAAKAPLEAASARISAIQLKQRESTVAELEAARKRLTLVRCSVAASDAVVTEETRTDRSSVGDAATTPAIATEAALTQVSDCKKGSSQQIN